MWSLHPPLVSIQTHLVHPFGIPEGVTAFAKWAPATGLFHRRYGVGEENGVGEWKKGHNWTTTDWTQERLMCIIYCTIDRKASGLQDRRPVDGATCCTWGSRHTPTTGLRRRKINISLSLSHLVHPGTALDQSNNTIFSPTLLFIIFLSLGLLCLLVELQV